MSLNKIIPLANESFSVGIFQDNLEKSNWHYHDSYEISFITEGSGKRIVGDSIEEFYPGDLVFLGRNLPHVWIAEKDRHEPTGRALEMVYLRFLPELVFPNLVSLPEFFNLKKAVELSDRGIQIVGDTLNEVSQLMLQLPYLKSFDRMLTFLKILDIIGKSESNITLTGKEYLSSRFVSGNRRIETIHNYLMNHYREDINLQQIAALVSMAEGSVCRYFKSQTGVALFEYLNKIKIEFACKLLMDPDLNINEVCFDSGFNNLSHFNKQFRKVKGLPPTQYRRQVRIER